MRFNFVVKTIKSVGINAKNETEALETLYTLNEKIISCQTLSSAYGFKGDTLDHEVIDVDLILTKDRKKQKKEGAKK